MSCGCETYTCIEGFLNPCSEGIKIPVEATYTGDLTGHVFFNGTMSIFGVGVTEGVDIVLPTEIFNEDYTHELRLYNEDTLLGCYWFKTILSYENGDFPVTPTGSGVLSATFTGNGTDTQTFPGIGEVNLIVIPNQPYTKGDWVQTGEQIVMNNGVTFYGEVLVQWVNS